MYTDVNNFKSFSMLRERQCFRTKYSSKSKVKVDLLNKQQISYIHSLKDCNFVPTSSFLFPLDGADSIGARRNRKGERRRPQL